MNKKMNQKKGFSLVEIIIYSGLISVLLFVVVQILVVGINIYKRFDHARNIQDTAINVIERIVSESRNASMISVAGSGVENEGQGSLTMHNINNNVLAKFIIENNGAINLYNGNGVLVGPLTPRDVTANGSYFLIASSTPESQMARVILILQSGTGENQKTETFYTSVIPRGSYNQ
jgi:type II secretory pathway pseudopilin PulG